MEINGANNSSGSPSRSLSNEIDYDLEQPVWNLEQLRQAATEQRLPRPRSLAWAVLLEVVPPPNADVVSTLKSSRNFYNELKKKLSMDPRGAIGDDPLSQNDESVWRQHFCDNELKSLILQDVVRTFPDELYFRDQDVQDLMVRVLFFWSRSHSQVGYRQGMHEILAPLLLELFLDRELAPDGLSDTLKYILSEEHLEHDSYMLFATVIRGLEKFYITGDMIVPSSNGRRLSRNPNEVLRYLDRVKEDYLVPLDPELAAHLTNSNISMELFGIRWLRLLFGREFPRSELAALWGFAFASGPTLPELNLLVAALLLAARRQLLDPDPGVVLAALMRPSVAPVSHVLALALHLRSPLQHARPPTPAALIAHRSMESPEMEQQGSESPGTFDSGSEGVAEGADVARELAALGVLRARLPPAAAALAAALPAPPPRALAPLNQILQLAALLQCRNHALIDVETALEAAEGGAGAGAGAGAAERVGRRQLVPVSLARRKPAHKPMKQLSKVKEVPLKLFHQVECGAPGDLPCLDPLRLRTD